MESNNFYPYVIFSLIRRKGKTLDMNKMLPREYFERSVDGNKN